MKKTIVLLIIAFAVVTVFAQVNSSILSTNEVASKVTVSSDDCSSCDHTSNGKRMRKGHGRGHGNGCGEKMGNGKGQGNGCGKDHGKSHGKGHGKNRTGKGINEGNGIKYKIKVTLADDSVSADKKAKLNNLLQEFNAEKSKKKCDCGTDSDCGAFKNSYFKKIEEILGK